MTNKWLIMSSLGTFSLPLFGGTQNLNIWSAPLTGGSGGSDLESYPLWVALNYSLTIFELVSRILDFKSAFQILSINRVRFYWNLWQMDRNSHKSPITPRLPHVYIFWTSQNLTFITAWLRHVFLLNLLRIDKVWTL